MADEQKVLFSRDFDRIEMEELARVLGDVDRFGPRANADFDATLRSYPHYRILLENSRNDSDFIDRYLPAISPILQGPFPLPGRKVINGPWSGGYKIQSFPECGLDAAFVGGKRVLDVGCNAGFDTFYLSSLGAAEVVGIEPSAFVFQAQFLGALYDRTNVRFVKCGWQALNTTAFGSFDIVNCQGIMYHEPDMFALLRRLVAMLAVGGMLILETHVTLNRSMSARYVAGSFWGDENWFWIPDLDTVEAMLKAVGLNEVRTVKSNPVPSRNPQSESVTLEGVPVGGRAYFTAVKTSGNPRTKWGML